MNKDLVIVKTYTKPRTSRYYAYALIDGYKIETISWGDTIVESLAVYARSNKLNLEDVLYTRVIRQTLYYQKSSM